MRLVIAPKWSKHLAQAGDYGKIAELVARAHGAWQKSHDIKALDLLAYVCKSLTDVGLTQSNYMLHQRVASMLLSTDPESPEASPGLLSAQASGMCRFDDTRRAWKGSFPRIFFRSVRFNEVDNVVYETNCKTVLDSRTA